MVFGRLVVDDRFRADRSKKVVLFAEFSCILRRTTAWRRFKRTVNAGEELIIRTQDQATKDEGGRSELKLSLFPAMKDNGRRRQSEAPVVGELRVGNVCFQFCAREHDSLLIRLC